MDLRFDPQDFAPKTHICKDLETLPILEFEACGVDSREWERRDSGKLPRPHRLTSFFGHWGCSARWLFIHLLIDPKLHKPHQPKLTRVLSPKVFPLATLLTCGPDVLIPPKVCVVTLHHRTLIFKWYLARLVAINKHPKDKCDNVIGMCGHQSRFHCGRLMWLLNETGNLHFDLL